MNGTIVIVLIRRIGKTKPKSDLSTTGSAGRRLRAGVGLSTVIMYICIRWRTLC